MLKIKQFFLIKSEPPKSNNVGPYFLYNVTLTDNISYDSKVNNEVCRSMMAVFLEILCTRTQFIIIVNKVSRFWFGFLIADVSDVDHIFHWFYRLVVFIHVGGSNG